MKKHKPLLIILLVFLCCLSLYTLYSIIVNISTLHFYLTNDYPNDMLIRLVPRCVIGLVLNICIEGFSVLGIVTLAKILQDKQLFATNDEQPAPQNNDETSINKE